jgi:AcrR family transcriptional regulator
VSLRTFYQHFDTRDDFALAIYAEMIRQAAEAIDRTMPKGSATTKFRHFVHSMVCPHEWNRLLAEYSAEAMQRSRALVREGFHLREARPDGYQAAVAPLREILASILGAESDDLSRNVSVVINSLITETYDVIVQDLDAEAVAEHLYRYHQRALGL